MIILCVQAEITSSMVLWKLTYLKIFFYNSNAEKQMQWSLVRLNVRIINVRMTRIAYFDSLFS